MARISEVTHAALGYDGSLHAPNMLRALRPDRILSDDEEDQIAEQSWQIAEQSWPRNSQANGLVVARIRDTINSLRRSGISDDVIAESLRQCANDL